MKKLTLLLSVISMTLFAQQPGYYNGTEELKGEELKAALHEIIDEHIDISYSDAKYILEYAQEDPANSSNLISFYTGVSVKKGTWGTGGDNLNREHIWAQSHGSLIDNGRPMNGDAFNLHAADASVNVTRSNYDFDYVTDGTYIAEADASYGGGAFEPSDRDKGEVARTLMYMAVRYEGTNGELDLELADAIGTAPSATHGKLSSLLQWNRDFPPTDFERRRNDRVAQCQGNRNPFIDNPAFADLIWADATISAVTFGNLAITPLYPKKTDNVVLSAEVLTILGSFPVTTLYYGKTRNADTYNVGMTGQDAVNAAFDLADFSGGDHVFYKIKADSGDSICGSFTLDTDDQVLSIAAVQGTGAETPFKNQQVIIAGVVTANFDNIFVMQDGDDLRDGIVVYSVFRGRIGDSIKVKGTAVEYNKLTEINAVTSLYNYGFVGEKEAIEMSINEINEDYEGVLVELTGITFDDGGNLFPGGDTYPYPTFSISDGVNDLTFYTRYDSRLNNMPIPNGTVNVKGVISQYNDTYQIMSYDTTWFTPTIDNTPAKIVSVLTEPRADSYTWVIVNFNEIIVEEDAVEEDNFSISDGVKIAKCYYNESTPNQVKMFVKNIGLADYTLTVSNIHDAFGNVLDSADFEFTSTVDKLTALSDNEVAELSLYPIPATGGALTISAEQPIESIAIYGLDGQLLLLEQCSDASTQVLDVSALSVGNYLIQVKINSQIQTRQFMVK